MSCRSMPRQRRIVGTSRPRRAHGKSALALALIALGLVAVPVAASNHDVCEGYTRKQLITRLGGGAAFSRTPATSVANLQEQMTAHRAEVEKLMADQGLAHLTDGLYAALDSGAVSERDLERGETFEWMAYRKRSGPTSYGPMCVAAKKTYDAFVIEVAEEKARPATAACSLKVSGGSCVGDRFNIDTSGSSPGVKVSIDGPGGGANPPSAAGTYRLTASAQAKGTKTVTTHTFGIPKVCVNLAYAGSETSEVEGDADTCEETASVMVKDCEPELSCSIQVDPSQVSRRESVTVNATSEGAESLTVEVTDPKGDSFATLTDFPATLNPKKTGVYQLDGTASNGGDSASCSAEFTVAADDSRWTARFFGLRVDPDEGPLRESTIRPDGVSERSHLHLDGAPGAGAELEYHFNDRVGLAGSVLVAALGSELFFDLDDEWESDEDDISFLAFLIGPNFHLTPDKKADVYFGLFAGLVDLGSTSYQVLGETQRRSFDADTAFGAQLGVDIPFGKGNWGFNLAARYMDLTVELGDDGPEVGADPLLVQAGFSYKF